MRHLSTNITAFIFVLYWSTDPSYEHKVLYWTYLDIYVHAWCEHSGFNNNSPFYQKFSGKFSEHQCFPLFFVVKFVRSFLSLFTDELQNYYHFNLFLLQQGFLLLNLKNMSVRIETSKFSLSCTVTPGLQIMPPNKIHFDYFHTRYDVIIANNAQKKKLEIKLIPYHRFHYPTSFQVQ